MIKTINSGNKYLKINRNMKEKTQTKVKVKSQFSSVFRQNNTQNECILCEWLLNINNFRFKIDMPF